MAVGASDPSFDREFDTEVDILKEIYINELEVERTEHGEIESISLQLHPATGDQVELKWVCLTLRLIQSPLYPEEPPDIEIKNPRGLAEQHVHSLHENLKSLAEDRKGECMLFELIELAKESLTQDNIPHGECVICKDSFDDGLNITKTACYHHFHCHCLLRYIEHSEKDLEEEYQQQVVSSPHMSCEKKQVNCPVCRNPITYNLDSLKSEPAPSDLTTTDIHLSPDVILLQHQMAALFRHQQQSGGIIDVEAEKNKFLVPSVSAAGASDDESLKGEVEVKTKKETQQKIVHVDVEKDQELQKALLERLKQSFHKEDSAYVPENPVCDDLQTLSISGENHCDTDEKSRNDKISKPESNPSEKTSTERYHNYPNGRNKDGKSSSGRTSAKSWNEKTRDSDRSNRYQHDRYSSRKYDNSSYDSKRNARKEHRQHSEIDNDVESRAEITAEDNHKNSWGSRGNKYRDDHRNRHNRYHRRDSTDKEHMKISSRDNSEVSGEVSYVDKDHNNAHREEIRLAGSDRRFPDNRRRRGRNHPGSGRGGHQSNQNYKLDRPSKDDIIPKTSDLDKSCPQSFEEAKYQSAESRSHDKVDVLPKTSDYSEKSHSQSLKEAKHQSAESRSHHQNQQYHGHQRPFRGREYGRNRRGKWDHGSHHNRPERDHFNEEFWELDPIDTDPDSHVVQPHHPREHGAESSKHTAGSKYNSFKNDSQYPETWELDDPHESSVRPSYNKNESSNHRPYRNVDKFRRGRGRNADRFREESRKSETPQSSNQTSGLVVEELWELDDECDPHREIKVDEKPINIPETTNGIVKDSKLENHHDRDDDRRYRQSHHGRRHPRRQYSHGTDSRKTQAYDKNHDNEEESHPETTKPKPRSHYREFRSSYRYPDSHSSADRGRHRPSRGRYNARRNAPQQRQDSHPGEQENKDHSRS